MVRATQAELGGPDKVGLTGVAPIRVEFQQHSLSYLDRLLLKKHRRYTHTHTHTQILTHTDPPTHTLTHTHTDMHTHALAFYASANATSER